MGFSWVSPLRKLCSDSGIPGHGLWNQLLWCTGNCPGIAYAAESTAWQRRGTFVAPKPLALGLWLLAQTKPPEPTANTFCAELPRFWMSHTRILLRACPLNVHLGE